MILADKIVQLRKQLAWSQEDLAEKMKVSRQSVSKWESANSIPDLNKIIILAEIFNVSTDFLLKDEIESQDNKSESKEPGLISISLEQALRYVDKKIQVANLTRVWVALCVCSVVPLFFFLAMAETNRLNLTDDAASMIGVISILIMVSIAVSFFIRTTQFNDEIEKIEEAPFDLAYGVHGVFKEKLEKYRTTYNISLSVGIFLFITCFVPVMVASMFNAGSDVTMMMLIVLMLMITAGIAIIMPVTGKYDALNHIIKDFDNNSKKSKRSMRAEKLAAFYWPLLTTIYLGWSLWTMSWGITWIIWPVGAVLFAALVGLMELFVKDED
jgi:transcriptional regulator with XRE-family HTH domain